MRAAASPRAAACSHQRRQRKRGIGTGFFRPELVRSALRV
ncbi:hypothetical protein EBI_26233 [Enterocytozoon bieneusi H348]|nr:hypothetical protein EBI_26233 [Enterocytozoon bieneusi H348]|eukprot:XP_002650521.1 hypothetical protein EBI_26233 [Enterocytozoon bieneusi H348]